MSRRVRNENWDIEENGSKIIIKMRWCVSIRRKYRDTVRSRWVVRMSWEFEISVRYATTRRIDNFVWRTTRTGEGWRVKLTNQNMRSAERVNKQRNWVDSYRTWDWNCVARRPNYCTPKSSSSPNLLPFSPILRPGNANLSKWTAFSLPNTKWNGQLFSHQYHINITKTTVNSNLVFDSTLTLPITSTRKEKDDGQRNKEIEWTLRFRRNYESARSTTALHLKAQTPTRKH